MSQSTYILPYSLAATFQDPQSRSDAPAPAPGGQNPTGGSDSGAATTGAGPTGPTGVPTVGGPTGDPNKPPPGPCASDEMMWVMLALPILMYFMMIRPEQKRKKEQQELLSAIKVGEKVVMLSGMHGQVVGLTDKTVTVNAGGANITFDRSAISRIVRDEPATEDAK